MATVVVKWKKVLHVTRHVEGWAFESQFCLAFPQKQQLPLKNENTVVFLTGSKDYHIIDLPLPTPRYGFDSRKRVMESQSGLNKNGFAYCRNVWCRLEIHTNCYSINILPKTAVFIPAWRKKAFYCLNKYASVY